MQYQADFQNNTSSHLRIQYSRTISYLAIRTDCYLGKIINDIETKFFLLKSLVEICFWYFLTLKYLISISLNWTTDVYKRLNGKRTCFTFILYSTSLYSIRTRCYMATIECKPHDSDSQTYRIFSIFKYNCVLLYWCFHRYKK